jgi:hypothetical protein
MHTKGKWKYESCDNKEIEPDVFVEIEGKGWTICELNMTNFSYSEAEANARRICQCVNNFDELVDCLKELVGIIDGINEGIDYTIDSLTCQPAREALAQAEKA